MAVARSYRMNRADVEDVVQEALLRFAKQEMNDSGMFDPAGVHSLSAKAINSNLKGNVSQRCADWHRAQKRSARIVAQSLDAVPEGSDNRDFLSVIESFSARRSTAARELCNGVNQVVSAFLEGENTPLVNGAIEDAMMRGNINTTRLAHEHGRSQPTVWREVARAKKRLRSDLKREGFGPS